MNILAVDDELVSREKLAPLIQGLNHDMVVASDGDEAWEIWESRSPRLVITDWNMPCIKGPELCRKIRTSEGIGSIPGCLFVVGDLVFEQ
jgi:putative two-component system response regulator